MLSADVRPNDPTAETTAPLLTDEEAAAGHSDAGGLVGSSPEDLSHRNTAQFWYRCLFWPVCFVLSNAIAFRILSAIMDHSKYLRSSDFRKLRKEGHATAEGAGADWFAPHHEEIVEERAWYAAHGSLAFAFLLLLDAVIIIRFAQSLERKVVRYCDELERRCDVAYGANAADDLGNEVHVPAHINDERSDFAQDHAEAFASHRLELFLRNRSSVKRSIMTNSSFITSALYLLATVVFSCCIAFAVKFGMITISSGRDGSYCFINPYVNMPSHCARGYSIASTSNQTKIPDFVRSWFDKKYSISPDCNLNTTYMYHHWGIENNRTSSVVDMVNGDTFFIGRMPGEVHNGLMKKGADGEITIYPSVKYSETWETEFHSDAASRSADGLLTTFCLPYTRWLNESGFESPDYWYDRDKRVLCYSEKSGTLRDRSFPNVSLHLKNNEECDYVDNLSLDGEILFMLCKPPAKKKKRRNSKYRVWDDDDRYNSGMDDDYIYSGWNYRHPHEIVDKHGVMKLGAYNTSTMTSMGIFDVKVEAISPHHRHEKEHHWCDSTHSWVFALLETAFIGVASVQMVRKGVSVAPVVLVGAAGCVMCIYADKKVSSAIFYLLTSMALSSVLSNKPSRPKWLPNESFWWLVYFFLVMPLLWEAMLFEKRRRTYWYWTDAISWVGRGLVIRALFSVIGLFAIYIKLHHPVIRVLGAMLSVSCALILPMKILDFSPLAFFGCVLGIVGGLALLDFGSEIDRTWRPFVSYLFRVLFSKMKKMWIRLKQRIRRIRKH